MSGTTPAPPAGGNRAGDDPAGLYVGGGVVPGAPTRCPSCGEPDPEAVFDGSRTNFFCRRCGTCTHIGQGHMWTVDPEGCPGCPRRSRCLSARMAGAGREA